MSRFVYGFLARIGPPLFVELADGAAPVSRPPEKKQCWGLTAHRYGTKHCVCDRKVRPNTLTCHLHKRSEQAAQELRARFEEGTVK
jgi:hypothetical protein